MKKLPLFAGILFLFMACQENKVPAVSSDTKKDSTSTENKEERNKKIVMESIEGFTSNNLDLVLKDAAPDMVDYGDGTTAAVKGIDSLRAALNSWLSNLKDYKADNLKLYADGDYVLAYGDWSGTFKNDIMGLKTKDKSFKVTDVDIFKLNDQGKIVEHRNVQAVNTIINQALDKTKK